MRPSSRRRAIVPAGFDRPGFRLARSLHDPTQPPVPAGTERWLRSQSQLAETSLLPIIIMPTLQGYLLGRCVNTQNEAGRPLPSASRDSLLKSLTKIQYHPILHLSSGRCAEALVLQRFPAPRASPRPDKTGELSMRTELHSRTAPVMTWSAPVTRLAIRQFAAMEGTRRPGFSCCCCL